jgi:hypothetical protein
MQTGAAATHGRSPKWGVTAPLCISTESTEPQSLLTHCNSTTSLLLCPAKSRDVALCRARITRLASS